MDAERPFERVCGVHELLPGRPLGVTLSDGARVCLVAHAGVVHAVSDRCPHLQFPLSEGEVDPMGNIVCSWHGAAYDCRTGRGVCGPRRGAGSHEAPIGRLTTYAVRVEDDAIYVRPAPDPF